MPVNVKSLKKVKATEFEEFEDIFDTKDSTIDDLEDEVIEDVEDTVDDEDQIADDSEVEDDEELVDEEAVDDDEDLFRVNLPKRKAKLEEDDYDATIGQIKAERVKNGKYGPWTKVIIPFEIKSPVTAEVVSVPFVANKSMSENSRLLPIIKGAWGRVPDEGFSLKQLEGKKVRVSIEYRVDDKGNVWENVASVRKPLPKKN